jgi:hypothetical protein
MNDPQCRNAQAGNIASREPETSATVTSFNYRCPVCCKMVDATRAEEILLHHEHVTHPRDFAFLFAKSLAA